MCHVTHEDMSHVGSDFVKIDFVNIDLCVYIGAETLISVYTHVED